MKQFIVSVAFVIALLASGVVATQFGTVAYADCGGE